MPENEWKTMMTGLLTSTQKHMDKIKKATRDMNENFCRD